MRLARVFGPESRMVAERARCNNAKALPWRRRIGAFATTEKNQRET